MAVIDGPHVFEVHTLRKIQGIFTQRKRARLTKYPVSNVSGKNTTVHNVNLRLCGRTLSDSFDNTIILERTSLHSFRRMPSETVDLNIKEMKTRTHDVR